AIQAYIDTVKALPAESVALTQAVRRVLAEDQYSEIDLPRFDQSAMDGYALRASDSQAAPSQLPVVNESAAGHSPASVLEAGTAWRIFTGAVVPEGADTVIPQERITLSDGKLQFVEPYPSGRNIRYRGEEIKAGSHLATSGQRLSPGLIASLANAGMLDVAVIRKPRIAVLITGDEVRSPQSLRTKPLRDSEIPDSNGTYIQNWLAASGYTADSITHIADTAQAVSGAITVAAEQADLVITTGGASVGDRDFIPSVAQENGFEQIFWRVAQKPGKPIFFSRRDKTILLGLPGNPGAVLVGMEVHARTILNLLEGQLQPGPTWRSGKLSESVQTDARRDRLVRMRLTQDDNGQTLLSPLGKQDSHMLSNLAEAAVLAHVPSREQKYEPSEVLNYIELTT
ncbi:MAG: molybdopterin molybdotransferase MoeA, partial [Nevskiales bacterium]